MSTDTEARFGAEGLRRIEAVTDPSLANLDVEGLLAELLDRVRDLLEVDTAAVLLLDPASQHLVATAARGIEEEVHQGFRVPIGEGFAGRIASERSPVIVTRVAHANVGNPILKAKGIRSLLGVPMLAEGVVIGVLHVGTLRTRQFTDADANLLQLVADRAALATQTRLSGVDRAAAVALQRSLLPPQLPALPGLDLSARYVTGAGGVGGDWYDVFHLPSGSLCLVIGDVVGRGLRAAVVMGRLRSALRAYALETEDPADILSRLDRKAQHFESDTMATAICAIVEPSLERVHMSVAGHPGPVLAHPRREAVLVNVTVDLPIGVAQERGGRRTNVIDLPRGAVMLLYTDGLVERRDTSIDVRMELLRTSVAAGPPDTVCATVMSKLVGGDAGSDDIAVLALRRQHRVRRVPGRDVPRG